MDEFHQPSSLFSLHTWQIERERLCSKVAKPIERTPDWVILPSSRCVRLSDAFTMIFLFLVKILTFSWNTYFRLKILHFFVEFRFCCENLSWNLENTKLDASRFLILCTGNKVHDSFVEWVSMWGGWLCFRRREKCFFNTSARFFLCRFRLENSDMYEWKKNASFKSVHQLNPLRCLLVSSVFKNFRTICLLEEYLLSNQTILLRV